jgi:uncharacterized protein involved in exopolysaccharide biosynthesis
MPVTLWRYKWSIVTPAILMLAATMAWSHHYLPERYRSEASILVVPARTPLPVVSTESLALRLRTISQGILSRTRLEKLIDEFDVYDEEMDAQAIERAVLRFRSETSITLRRNDWSGAGTSAAQPENAISGFTVSFTSAKPQIAMRVAQRLAAMVVQENLEESEVLSNSGLQFVQARIKETRLEVDATEAAIEAKRKKGLAPTRSEAIEYEVQQEGLRALLLRQQELAYLNSAVRRQIGEQFRVVEAARLPKKPIGPNRLTVNIAGGAVGLGIGLLLAWARRPRVKM